MPELITTLAADLEFFDRPATAFAALETFLGVAQGRIRSAALDPEALRLPDGLGDERARLQALVDELDHTPRRRFLAVSEREFDLTDPPRRADFARLAYCSTLATVWSAARTETLFEATDYGYGSYWLPEDLKAGFFDRLSADGWEVPEEWLTATPKERKPWWRRRS